MITRSCTDSRIYGNMIPYVKAKIGSPRSDKAASNTAAEINEILNGILRDPTITIINYSRAPTLQSK